MPKFDIPQQRVGMSPARVTGAGAVGEGIKAFGRSLGRIEEQKRREEALKLSGDINNLGLELGKLEESVASEYPTGEKMYASYEQQSEKLVSDFVKNAPGKLQLQAEAKLSQYRNASLLRVMKDSSRRKGISYAADSAERVVQNANVISRATDASSYEQALDMVELEYATLSEYSLSAAEDYKFKAIQDLGKAEFRRELDTEGYAQALESVEAGKYDSLDPAVVNNLAKHAQAKVQVDINDTVSNSKRMIRAGIPTSYDLVSTAKMAEEVGLIDLAQEARDLQADQNNIVNFAQSGLSEQRQVISNLNEKMMSGQGTPEDLRLMSGYNASLNYKVSQIKDDPWGYYKSIGVAPEEMLEIDFTQFSPDQVQEVFQDRKELLRQINLRDGVQVAPLTEMEVGSLQMLMQGPPRQMADTLSNISKGMPSEFIGSISRQLRPKDESLARYMAISMTDKKLAETLIMGKDREAPKLSEDDIVSVFYGSDYAQSLPPDVHGETFETVKEHYRSTYTGTGNPKEYVHNALKAIYGEPITLSNGSTMIQPRRSDGSFTSRGDVVKAVKNMTTENWLQAYKHLPKDSYGNDIPIDELKDIVRFVPHGANKYGMKSIGSGDIGAMLLGEDGSPMVIDINVLVDTVPDRSIFSGLPRMGR
mgnify:CR=1 FL=1